MPALKHISVEKNAQVRKAVVMTIRMPRHGKGREGERDNGDGQTGTYCNEPLAAEAPTATRAMGRKRLPPRTRMVACAFLCELVEVHRVEEHY